MKAKGTCKGCGRRRIINVLALCKRCNRDPTRFLSKQQIDQAEAAAAAVAAASAQQKAADVASDAADAAEAAEDATEEAAAEDDGGEKSD